MAEMSRRGLELKVQAMRVDAYGHYPEFSERKSAAAVHAMTTEELREIAKWPTLVDYWLHCA